MSDVDAEGKDVAGGKHVVPPGVAVEELDGGKKKLSKECPQDLALLLQKKNLIMTYDKMVDAIVSESNTRNLFGKWKDEEFASIVDLFRDDFAKQGIKVALCKRSSGSGTKRWLEFIDIEVAGNYVSQYDVANQSGQTIKTCYTTLEFPNGVAVEELKQWNGRKLLKDKIPPHVQKMLEDKDLFDEYDALVEACINEGVGSNWKAWNIKKLGEVKDAHAPKFEAKGVSIFVSHKQEYISHGQHGGHTEHFRWIEFVDREEQPNYFPQRDADTKDEQCVIS